MLRSHLQLFRRTLSEKYTYLRRLINGSYNSFDAQRNVQMNIESVWGN